MRALGAMRGVGAAVVLLMATGCGGGESSGLATLEATQATAAAVDPEETGPVAEPTAVAQPVSETAGEGAGVPVEADPADTADTDDAMAAATTSEPENMNAEESLGTGEAIDEEPAEPGELTDEERLLAFAECMRENGVDFPDPVVEADGTVTFGLRPGGGGGGAQRLGEIGRDPDLPAARDACGGSLEGLAFGPGGGGVDLIEIQDNLLEFAQCMRDNGVDMGDPDLSRFGPGGNDDAQPGGVFGGIDRDDPDIATAFEACQQQLPEAVGPRFGGGR